VEVGWLNQGRCFKMCLHDVQLFINTWNIFRIYQILCQKPKYKQSMKLVVDFWLLKVQQQIFNAYSWREQVQQYIWKIYTEMAKEWDNLGNKFWLRQEMFNSDKKISLFDYNVPALSKSAYDVFVVQGEKENHIWIKMKNVKLTKNKYRLFMIPNILFLLKKYNLYPAGSQPCMFYVQ